MLAMMVFDTPEENDRFTLLYTRYAEVVVNYIYKYIGDLQLAEDVTHDAFMAYSEKAYDIKDPKQSLGILLRIAKNAAIDQIRKKKYEQLTGYFELQSMSTKRNFFNH